MGNEKHRPHLLQYKPEAWRDDAANSTSGQQEFPLLHPADTDPTVREQCRLFDLLGRINYKILSGNRVYVEVDGVVYKTLYGGYWRSVFTGIEHYLLRCEQVSGAWTEENTTAVDLPIAYSSGGWTARGHSLSFILNRDLTEDRRTPIHRLLRLRKFKSSTANMSSVAL